MISGEIPILLDYDFNAYRGQYTDKAPVQFVIPKEGTLVFPYVMGLVNKGPNPDNGKKVLDFVLSDESQAMWGNAYLRPVFADRLSAEGQGEVPARRGICPRQAGGPQEPRQGAAADRRALPQGSELTSNTERRGGGRSSPRCSRLRPHPEERSEGARLEGWARASRLLPILRDGAEFTPRYSRGASSG